MKICIVNLNVYCLFNPNSSAPMGGAELDMYTLAKELQKYHKVVVITGDWGQNPIERYGNVTIIKSTKLKIKPIIAIYKIFKSLKEANSDIYISSGAGAEPGLISLFCLLSGKKYIYRTAHDVDCNKSYINKNGLIGQLYKFGLEHASQIITSVEKHKILLTQNHLCLEKKIKNINLGIIIKKTIIKQKYGVLWIARCTRWKNPNLFLKIASKFPKYLFTMICPKQSTEISLYRKIKKTALQQKNVKFIDFVPYHKIQTFYNKAYVFINTSESEGFTYTLIQCGLGKTPIIYYKVNPDNVIIKHNIGYYSGGSEKNLCKQIKILIENRKDWVKKSNNIQNYVNTNHDIRKTIHEWNKIFLNLNHQISSI